VRIVLNRAIAAAPASVRLCLDTSQKFGPDMVVRSPSDTWNSATRLSGSAYGNGFSNTPLTTLKMAVLAPMPSARVTTATAANPGLRQRRRTV
jgi:hypothetical protein